MNQLININNVTKDTLIKNIQDNTYLVESNRLNAYGIFYDVTDGTTTKTICLLDINKACYKKLMNSKNKSKWYSITNYKFISNLYRQANDLLTLTIPVKEYYWY